MIRFMAFLLFVLLFFAPALILAQGRPLEKQENLRAIVKDMRGEKLEGYLRQYPNQIIVTTKDGQEKSIPLKIIESIKVEKIQGGIPGADQLGAESYYSVRIQNSQEVFTLKKKVTFSLNTSAGVVTKTLDPEAGQGSLRKDSSSTLRSSPEQPFIRGEGVALSLEIKF